MPDPAPVPRSHDVVVALAPELACPRCHRAQLGILPRSGDLWLRCLNDRCRLSLWVIVLAHGATVRELATIVSSFTGARALVRRAFPNLANLTDAQLEETPLAGPERGSFLVIGAPGHVRTRHEQSSGEAVLRTLGIL